MNNRLDDTLSFVKEDALGNTHVVNIDTTPAIGPSLLLHHSAASRSIAGNITIWIDSTTIAAESAITSELYGRGEEVAPIAFTTVETVPSNGTWSHLVIAISSN